MKQIIPFVKDVKLNSKIFDITSIALEHDLKMENNDSVVGTFKISGKYKASDISISEEEFEKEIDFDITLDDKYDANKVQIDIDDFYYEIINQEFLRVHIDVLIDNLIYVLKEEKVELKNIKSDENQICDEKEEVLSLIEDVKKEDESLKRNNYNEKGENIIMENSNISNDLNLSDDRNEKISINTNFLSDEEKYITYKVHIIRENETIDTIIEKYGVSKEELQKYNELEVITLGTKIIIPLEA